jgi:hypothetical protein
MLRLSEARKLRVAALVKRLDARTARAVEATNRNQLLDQPKPEVGT